MSAQLGALMQHVGGGRWHTPIYIYLRLVKGKPYSPKYIDFAPILLYIHISLSCFTQKNWVLYSFCGENLGFLPHSSAYFTPQHPQLELEPQLESVFTPTPPW